MQLIASEFKALFWVSALLGVACATTATGRKQLILLPEDELSAMGQQAFTAMKKEEPIDTAPRTNNYVTCVAHALLDANNAKTAQWEIVVFESKEANAFALPGRKIGVYTGMLGVAKTQDQLAAVLGHEIAHVTQHHSNERVSQTLLAEGGMTAASAALGSEGTTHDVAMAALGIGAQFGVLMPFGRTQESEADVVGLEYMARAGFDPRGAVQLWQNMAAAEGGSPPEFLSTHPSSESRIHDLEKRMPSAWKLYEAARSRGDAPRCVLDRFSSVD
ncbi:MAG TPA: M48 family metallopeptidase [Polyangiaceae bacterium]|jgi:predicted Zn-dependent protease|nr:M48 family metallopeptidase [Polyangiaceae bacterium]